MCPNTILNFPGDVAGLYSITGLTGIRALTHWALKGAQWLGLVPRCEVGLFPAVCSGL